MPFLKLAFEKIPFSEQTLLYDFFERLNGENACLLEKCNDGRYSYITYDPFLLVWSQKDVLNISVLKKFAPFNKIGVDGIIDKDPKNVLDDIFDSFRFKGYSPVPFFGGAVGFLTYDYACTTSGFKQKVFDDLNLCDFRFNFYDKIIVFDNFEKSYYLIGCGITDISAKRKVEDIKLDLERTPRLMRKGEFGDVKSNINKNTYIEKVSEIKNILKEYNELRVNFSVRFKSDCSLDSWSFYKKIIDNNSSCSCFMKYQDYSFFSFNNYLYFSSQKNDVDLNSVEFKQNNDDLGVFDYTYFSDVFIGKPVKKAMEVIDFYEDFNRGFYGGSICLVSFLRDKEFYALNNPYLFKDGTFFHQVGSDISVETDCDLEFEKFKLKIEDILSKVLS